MVFCLPATSSSLLLLTCHLLTGNDFVIENLSQADATATKHVAPAASPTSVGPNGKDDGGPGPQMDNGQPKTDDVGIFLRQAPPL